MTVKMGMAAKDKITGFQGVVTGICEYLTDCTQALVCPPVDEKGSARDSKWIDIQRLEQVGTDIIKIDNGATPGCDMAAPIR